MRKFKSKKKRSSTDTTERTTDNTKETATKPSRDTAVPFVSPPGKRRRTQPTSQARNLINFFLQLEQMNDLQLRKSVTLVRKKLQEEAVKSESATALFDVINLVDKTSEEEEEEKQDVDTFFVIAKFLSIETHGIPQPLQTS